MRSGSDQEGSRGRGRDRVEERKKRREEKCDLGLCQEEVKLTSLDPLKHPKF